MPDNSQVETRRKPRAYWKDYLEKFWKPLDDGGGELVQVQNEIGQEMPDDTPEEPPLGYVKQPSMVDHIRQMIQSEKLRREAEEAGQESFEEADDFDVPDDPFPMSGHENDPQFEPALPAADTASPVVPSASGEAPPPGPSPEAEAPKPVPPPKAAS